MNHWPSKVIQTLLSFLSIQTTNRQKETIYAQCLQKLLFLWKVLLQFQYQKRRNNIIPCPRRIWSRCHLHHPASRKTLPKNNNNEMHWVGETTNQKPSEEVYFQKRFMSISELHWCLVISTSVRRFYLSLHTKHQIYPKW